MTVTAHWNALNIGGNNASGFSAVPGGYRSSIGSFDFIRTDTYFWSATEYDNRDAWYCSLNSLTNGVFRSYYGNKSVGASVRCLRDWVIEGEPCGEQAFLEFLWIIYNYRTNILSGNYDQIVIIKRIKCQNLINWTKNWYHTNSRT
jgi:hypothetical protein